MAITPKQILEQIRRFSYDEQLHISIAENELDLLLINRFDVDSNKAVINEIEFKNLLSSFSGVKKILAEKELLTRYSIEWHITIKNEWDEETDSNEEYYIFSPKIELKEP